MDATNGILELIYSDEAKCVGCNRCIRNCPIDGANIAYVADGKNKVRVDARKCIRCGSCLESCSHGARGFRDDTEAFFEDLARGRGISVVAAPAARVNFEDPRRLIGYLKSVGVHFVYDVSFGADITTWAYLKAIRERGLDSVVAQPCPAIVNYVEKFRPELLGKLAPVHSPTLCTAVYMKEYAKIGDRIAFLSPCIGKSDEFRDPDTKGYVTYNVTYSKLREWLERERVDLSRFPAVDFDDAGCWLGCLYSRPGGLRENVELLAKGAWVKQVEGSRRAYGYLDEYAKRVAARKPLPLLVDILNCEDGCNCGTATRKDVPIDDADSRLNALKAGKLGEKGRLGRTRSGELFRLFDRNLDLRHFLRSYTDRSVAGKAVSSAELELVFRKLHKDTPESREIDCSACGYETCEAMARAIHDGYNNVGNCLDYNRHEIELESRSIEEKTRTIDEMAACTNEIVGVLDEVDALNLDVKIDGDFMGDFAKIKDSINRILATLNATLFEIKAASEQFNAGAQQVSAGSADLAEGTSQQAAAVDTLSGLIGMLAEKTRLNAGNAEKARDLSASAKKAAEDGNRKMSELLRSMEEINASSSNITKILKTIDDIAFQTNILALNAAIEAARAGKYGKGFAVVANEVRNLAARCSDAARESAESIEESLSKTRNGTEIANATAAALGEIMDRATEIARIVEEIASASTEQKSGIGDIDRNVTQVSQVVQSNSSVSHESAATSEQLSAQAVALKERVSRFRLRER